MRPTSGGRLVPRVADTVEIAVHDGLQRQTATFPNRSCWCGAVMSDNAVWSVRAVRLQAFNTEITKNHGAARSGSDDKSPQAVLQQPHMEIKQQAEAQAAHAQVGQDLGVMRRQDIRNSFDFNDQLPVHENVRAKAFVELDAFVSNGNSRLPLEGASRLLQLMTEAALINGFQHARSGQPMHLDRQPDDSFGQFAGQQHSALSPCRSVVLRALRVKCLTLRNGEPRGPNGQSRAQPSFRADPIFRAGADFGSSPEVSLQNQRRRAVAAGLMSHPPRSRQSSRWSSAAAACVASMSPT
jgi:hypothetical protein